MAKGDAWSQALSKEPKGEERPRVVPGRGETGRRTSPLIMAGTMVGMAIAALLLALFVIKPLLVSNDAAAAKQKPLPGYPLGSVVVNVAETDGRRYLKATVEVEPNGPKHQREIEGRRSQLVDLMIGYLSAKTIQEVTTAEGRDQIKKDLTARFNAELGGEKIARVYFMEFVVQ